MWRPDDFKNPYGDEWFMSSCNHQYALGESYEQGFNDCIQSLEPLIRKIAPSSKLVDILYEVKK